VKAARWAALAALVSAAAHAQPEAATPVALVRVDAGAVEPPAVEDVQWTVYDVPPLAVAPPVPDVARLRSAYLDADFLRCLGALREPSLALETLTRDGHLREAATVAWLATGCLLGAEDHAGATTLVDRALTLGLPLEEAQAEVAPPVHVFVEARRVRATRSPSLRVTVSSTPPGARLAVDGREVCEVTPCTVRLRRGEHLFRLRAFGFRDRDAAIEVEDTTPIVLALDRAPVATVLAQLAGLRARRVDLTDPTRLRQASLALGVPTLALVTSDRDRAGIAVYDRTLGRVVARLELPSARDLAAAVATAMEAWRTALRPPLRRNPWLWVGVVSLVLAAGTTAAVLSTRRPSRYVLDP